MSQPTTPDSSSVLDTVLQQVLDNPTVKTTLDSIKDPVERENYVNGIKAVAKTLVDALGGGVPR